MPAVIVDSSVLITLAAGEQFHLLREFYSTIHIPPEVWNETTVNLKTFGVQEVQKARADGWLIVQSPQDLTKVLTLPYNLQPGETEALALALEIPGSLLLVDDAQGRKAAAALGIA
jgi:predicted nucleic acid-binding protein